MRISDWSSDVCSSDLLDHVVQPSGGAAASHHQILDLSGAVAAATAPRASSSALEAGDQLLRYGSNFGGVGGLSAIAAYNSAERAAVQLDNVDTPHVAPEFVLSGKRPDGKSVV